MVTKPATLRIDNGPSTPAWWKNFRRELIREMSADSIVNNYIDYYLAEQYSAVINSDEHGRFLRFEDEHTMSVFLLKWS